MQDLQVARYAPVEGEPSVLHDMRVMWLSTIRQRHQDWFPGSSREAEVDQAGHLDLFLVLLHCDIRISHELLLCCKCAAPALSLALHDRREERRIEDRRLSANPTLPSMPLFEPRS